MRVTVDIRRRRHICKPNSWRVILRLNLVLVFPGIWDVVGRRHGKPLYMMSGHVGNLSAQQAAILEKFRQEVGDILGHEQLHDDYYLTRWLRARDYDLKKSVTMLRNHINWRRQYDVDTVLDDYVVPEVLQKYYFDCLFGVDKTGAPVRIERLGPIDLRGLLRSATKKEIIKTRIAYIDGTQIEKISIICDLEGFGMNHLWKPGMDLVMELNSLYEKNYPERVKNIYLINAPKVFPIIFKVAKPFMPEETKKKMKVLGPDYQETLQKDIAADQLPKFLGGTCVDPDGDPYCPSKICPGGKVPVEYYRTADVEKAENYKETTVNRGSSFQVDFNVEVPNSVIR
ncbi:hypothetical protein ScPMuIL_011711 [Solemya velum]